jgi:hypothetical protein
MRSSRISNTKFNEEAQIEKEALEYAQKKFRYEKAK